MRKAYCEIGIHDHSHYTGKVREIMSKTYNDVLAPILKESGEILSGSFGRVGALRQKTDSFVDVVTELDLKIEELIIDRLRKYDPSIPCVGEESGGKFAERMWLIDPIDGTGHFIRGIPFCTTMIALIEKGEVVFSVIHDFVRGDVYSAEAGKGSNRNKEPIRVSSRPIRQAYISLESVLKTPEQVYKFRVLQKKCAIMHTINCGYEFALVASGKIEGRISLNPYGQVWDYAAGALLVKEAGGRVMNIGKNSYDYKNLDFLAVNGIVYEELTKGKEAIFPVQ